MCLQYEAGIQPPLFSSVTGAPPANMLLGNSKQTICTISTEVFLTLLNLLKLSCWLIFF